MIIREESGSLVLDEPEVFTALRIAPFDGPRPAALTRLGEWIDDEHVFVAPTAIAALAGSRVAIAAWAESFDAMIAYAVTAGWADEQGRVRVHVGA